MKQFLSIVVPKYHTSISKPIENIKKIIDLVHLEKSDLIIFGELATTAYTSYDDLLTDTLIKESDEALRSLLDESKKKDSIIIIGAPLRIEEQLFSVAYIISKGSILRIVPKVKLHKEKGRFENRYLSPFKTKDLKINKFEREVLVSDNIVFQDNKLGANISISFDTMFYDHARSTNNQYYSNVNIVLGSVINSPKEKTEFNNHLLSLSYRTLSTTIYCPLADGESNTDCLFVSDPLVIEAGEILELKSSRTAIDLEYLQYKRRVNNLHFTKKSGTSIVPIQINKEREIDDIIKNYRSFSKYPFYHELANNKDINDSLKQIIDIQAKALASRLDFLSGSSVLGVSGGLDSTLALFVALRAESFRANKKKIYTITMPSANTSLDTLNISRDLMKIANSEFIEIEISKAIHQHLEDISHQNILDVTYQNVQARERTQILMDYANKINGIVIGTSDLSEIVMGFSTYNGDHMAMYNVNCSIPKTLVRELIRYYSENLDRNFYGISKKVLDNSITPELLPTSGGLKAQKTEEIIGNYEIIDFIIYHHIFRGASLEDTEAMIKAIYNDKSYDSIINFAFSNFKERFKKNQFKRNVTPEGINATGYSLSSRGFYISASEIKGNN